MPTDWDQLQHAYGTASDVPQLFEQVADPEMAPVAWEELWSRLCHQGTVDTLAGDSDSNLDTLENLLAIEGVPVWSTALGPDLHCIECPSCTASLEADFYANTPGIRRRDPSSRIQRITPRDPTLVDIRPTPPADLGQLATRLHHMATEAHQPAVAEHLSYLFGRTNCPDCRADFSVAEQIEAFLSS